MSTVTRTVRPQPLDPNILRRKFVRGRVSPRGVVWFGVRSFWGHLRHFLAAAIATENIDSRDWMTPDTPATLLDRIAKVLGGTTGSRTLVEALHRDLWIDYIADTGDDVSVSRAVAQLLIAPYELPDPDNPGAVLAAPRGELLIFGGDTAYPVATADEITQRVITPFNQILDQEPKGPPRVLLGIPGNHDWYDGLDGFSRLFRIREDGPAKAPRHKMMAISRNMMERQAEWAREFVRGGQVEKPKELILTGYVPVQNASYFILPLTHKIHLFAVDRQLRGLDDRQRRHHFSWYLNHPQITPWVMLPDPLYHFGETSSTGLRVVQNLGLDFSSRQHFLLSGDIHHYERSHYSNLLQVIAGGGGAFAHPAPVSERQLQAEVRWPSVAQSRALLNQVPWKVAGGRSGFLPHFALGGLFGLTLTANGNPPFSFLSSGAIVCTVTVIYALIGGLRRNARAVLALALGAGLLTASIPVLVSQLLAILSGRLHYHFSAPAVTTLAFIAAVFAGAWIFGAYLALLTHFGLENTQAFTALDHPGFKHFLRLRVRADGKGIDAWCIGLLDPLAPNEQAVLVDHFTWRP